MHSALDLIQALDELFGATTGERASLLDTFEVGQQLIKIVVYENIHTFEI